MSRCLSDHELQSIVDGRGPEGSDLHAVECPDCARRLEAREPVTERLLDAAGKDDLPRPGAGCDARAPRQSRRGLRRSAPRRCDRFAAHRDGYGPRTAAAAALLLVLVVIPSVDRQTTVSAEEILGRSRTALGADITGIEVLTSDLALDGVLGDLIPQEHAGRFTVEETINHDHEGRYRIVKLAADGQVVGGAADDSVRQTRVRYLRADGTGFLFRFTAAEPAVLSVPALKRAVLQTFIAFMQTSSGQTLRELQRDGEACYQVEIDEGLVPAGLPFALGRARAVVTAADARLVDFPRLAASRIVRSRSTSHCAPVRYVPPPARQATTSTSRRSPVTWCSRATS